MTVTLNQHETPNPAQPEATSSLAKKATRREIGGRALIHAEGASINDPLHKTPDLQPIVGFEHLFPATLIPSELLLTEAPTADGAERLLEKLEDNTPHKDYAVSQLALYHMEQGNLLRAYAMLHAIHDEGVATHVLSQLVAYEDYHQTKIIELKKLSRELHELAIDAYDHDPTVVTAYTIREASQALPDDDELRLFAKIATLEHLGVFQDNEELITA
jgi:hypothetical protein